MFFCRMFESYVVGNNDYDFAKEGFLEPSNANGKKSL